MPELRTFGSVRGALSNGRPYRDHRGGRAPRRPFEDVDPTIDPAGRDVKFGQHRAQRRQQMMSGCSRARQSSKFARRLLMPLRLYVAGSGAGSRTTSLSSALSACDRHGRVGTSSGQDGEVEQVGAVQTAERRKLFGRGVSGRDPSSLSVRKPPIHSTLSDHASNAPALAITA